MPLYFFALIFFISTSSFVFAQQGEIPFEGSRNTIEYKQAGNTYTWSPVTGETPKSGIPYRPDLSKGAVSDTEPKVKWSPRLPYDHKGGDAAKVNIRASVDPAKVAAKAKDAIKAGAAGLATGGGYVAVASIACTLLCDAAIDALKDWGVDNLKIDNDDLFVEASAIPSDSYVSDGYYWSLQGIDIYGLSPGHACSLYVATIPRIQSYEVETTSYYDGWYCSFKYYDGSGGSSYILKRGISSCPAGNFIVDGACSGSEPSVYKPFSEFYNGKYMGEGWSHHWAKMTAQIVAANGNVFTDGTSVEITGPSIVPLSTSETRTSVNLIPGTNTPAPVGHTGPTDPGTQTTTTTTTAKNTYTPAPFSSSSGPSMTTTQQTQTVTNITNNITNITTTENTTITESDDSPEKEQKEFCEQNPDSLVCAELDTPEAEIPRDTVNITFAPENLGFGAGTCPADKQIGPYTFSYAATCDILASYVKPLVIALALFGALLIIFVGKTDA